MKYFLESLLFTTFLSLVLLSTLNAGGTLSRQEPIVNASESKAEIEDLYEGTDLSKISQDVVSLMMEIKKARGSRLVSFKENELEGMTTRDKKNKIFDRKERLNERNAHTIAVAISNNRRMGIDYYIEYDKLRVFWRRDLILREIEWHRDSTRKACLWQKTIAEEFSKFAISNDGKNVFLMNDNQTYIAWNKLQKKDSHFLLKIIDSLFSVPQLEEVAEINIAIPKEYKSKIVNMGYLDSFGKLCLFDKNQDALCLIDLEE